MLRKGFTLIELLIVITIIAILAGAAIPYVQDYVEDARIAKAKGDLDEIRNAVIRFELDRGIQYLATTTAALVGPYLDKAPVDPWGVPYVVSASSSVVFSCGPNRDSNHPEFGGAANTLGDDIGRDTRPPLAISKAYWIDNDKSGSVNANDTIKLRFTRPANATQIALLATADYAIKNGITGAALASTMSTVAINTTAATNSTKEATVTLLTVTNAFVPGRDTINLSTTVLHDVGAPPYGPATASQNLVVIQSL